MPKPESSATSKDADVVGILPKETINYEVTKWLIYTVLTLE
jgi:hypothetical protein